MKLVKPFLTLLTITATILAIAAELEVNVSVNPTTVAAGEMVQFTLTANKSGAKITDYPELENGRWLSNSVMRRTSIVNGVGSYSYTIPIQTTKEGTLTIPPLEVSVGKKVVKTTPLEVRVLPPGEQPALPESSGESLTLKEALFGGIRLLEKRDSYYVGEEIPLVLELFYIPQLRPAIMEYPELLGLGQAVFHDYSSENPQNRKFAPVREAQPVTLSGRTYASIVFSTAFQAIAPGNYKPEATINLGILQPSESQRRRPRSFFDDDFFEFFETGSRRTPYKLLFDSPEEIVVKPLPPAPENAINLGLLGHWEMDCKFDQNAGTVGEPITLNLVLSGKGASETLSIPKLTLPGFRVYPGEVKKQATGVSNQVTVRYALIPLQVGVQKLELKFATFDSESGNYDVREFKLELPVAESTHPVASSVTESVASHSQSGASVTESEEHAPAPVREEIFYQKPNPGRTVSLPLIRNQLGFILVCVIAGPLIWLLLELIHHRRVRLVDDPEFQRRRDLRHRLPDLLRKLRSAEGVELERLLREEVVLFLADALNLSHGASAGEVADKLDDPELKELFKNAENAGFRPGATSGMTSADTMKKLGKFLKRFGVLILIVATGVLYGEGTDFNAAFDRGDFKQALEDYTRQLDPKSPAPALLYNIGSTCYRMDDLPQALWRFEQAWLLSPRDSETLENINLIKRRLAQPELGHAQSPLALLGWCRDRLRPDQYWAMAALIFALMCIGMGLRYHFSKSIVIYYESICALVLILTVVAALTQVAGPYRSDRGIVNGSTLEIRSLPASTSGRVEASVPGGTTATVIERRGQWLRIQANGRDGWVPTDRVNIIFSGGVFRSTEM